MRIRTFTLIEVLAAIGIIAVLAAMLVGGASYAARASADAKTKSLLKQMELALEAYLQDRGYYPTERSDKKVAWNQAGFTSTNGVLYLPNYHPDTFLDSWGEAFYYVNHASEGYRLWSLGRDGSDGTEDDITSWRRE